MNFQTPMLKLGDLLNGAKVERITAENVYLDNGVIMTHKQVEEVVIYGRNI